MRRLLPVFILLSLGLTACARPDLDPTPVLFNPPTVAVTPTRPATAQPTAPQPSPTPSCTNDLRYLQDLTIPDGTVVEPGETLDKRWQVRNDGSCNWDGRYSLIHVTGPDLGGTSPQALYPALAGSEATIRIHFTAPEEPGIYRSAWQAAGPDGQPFGDWIFIEVVVP